MKEEKKGKDQELKECEACEVLGDYMCAGTGGDNDLDTDKDG